MANYSLNFYDGSPFDHGFGYDSPGTVFTYTGPGTADGSLEVTDTGTGTDGADLTRNETATADATINGLTSTGAGIYAGGGFLIEDTQTGQSFAVIRLVVEDGPAAGQYTLSEVPLVAGRDYELRGWATSPSAGSPAAYTYSAYVCFAPATLIETPQGPLPVEDLRVGSRVITLDHGPQTIIWTGARSLRFDAQNEKQKPVLIQQDALGAGCPSRDLIVSPQHRILFWDAPVGATASDDAFLAPAKFFVANNAISVMRGKRAVTYHTLMTARHEIIFANGLAVQTFYPGPQAMALLRPEEWLQIQCALVKAGRSVPSLYGEHARPSLSRGAFRGYGQVRGVGLPARKRSGGDMGLACAARA